MRSLKRMIVPFVAAGALTLGMVGSAAAAPPNFVVTGGLVNVTLVDLVDVDDIVVQVPIAAAANICNLDVAEVAVLAAIASQGGIGSCDADANSRANN